MEKLFIGYHIESGIVKFTELMQDVCQKLKNVDPATKLSLHVLPLLEIKEDKTLNCDTPKESKEELLESIQKILVWYVKQICL
jgi:Fe-S-cluster formation regulator IscX/YfhJ